MRYFILFVIYLFACSSSGWAIVKINGYTPTISNADYLQYVRYLTVPIGSQSGTTWDAGNNTTGLTDAQIQAIVTAIVGLENPLNQEIYNKMQSSTTETFSFTDINQAKAVVQHRIQAIAMMNIFNSNGGRQFLYVTNGPPGQDYESFVSDWKLGSRVKFFFSQVGGTPDQAITQICTPPTGSNPNVYGDCLGAIETCIWWGADQAYGATAFNAEFGSTPLDMDPKKSSAHHHLAAAVDTSVIIPGDWVYFKNDNYNQVINDPFIATAVLKGAVLLWSGENAFYLGGGTYGGLGASGTAASVRAEEMNAYNNDLAPVRTKFGDTYNGMNISAMTSGDVTTRIQIVNIQRIVP